MATPRTMTSAEPGRKSAYSPDIGWRVIWQRLAMESSFEDIGGRAGATGTAGTAMAVPVFEVKNNYK